jgi:hypothetical protein
MIKFETRNEALKFELFELKNELNRLVNANRSYAEYAQYAQECDAIDAKRRDIILRMNLIELEMFLGE